MSDLHNKGGFKIENLLLDVLSLILKGIIALMAMDKYGATYKELMDDEEDDDRVPFFFGPTVLGVWSMALDSLLANGSVLGPCS